MTLAKHGRFSRVGPLAGCLITLGLFHFACESASGQVLQPQPGTPQLAPGVHLPTERTSRRQLEEVRRQLASGQYGIALRFLDDVLARSEDVFVEAVDRQQRAGMKSEALRVLANLPRGGREIYHTTYGITARKALEAGLAEDDIQAVRNVMRRYFHTPAGYEAALIVAGYESDQQRYLSAASIYQSLLDASFSRQFFGPELGLLTAIAWLRVEREQDALRAAATIGNRIDQDWVVAGQTVPRSISPEELTSWLKSRVTRLDAARQGVHDWVVYRGNAARNAESVGGSPHLNPEWQVPLHSYYLERLVESQWTAAENGNVALLPAASPIAIGNVIVTRNARNLLAVDFDSGKQIWDIRPDEDPPLELLEEALRNHDEVQVDTQATLALNDRLYRDAVFSAISSDGERVYAVRGLRLDNSIDMMRWTGAQAFRAFGRQIESEITASNTLVALDLKTEGKRIWEIHGQDVYGPLSGAFFLGPPLAVDGRLYVLAEIKSGIYLIAIRNTNEPPFWELDWMQHLANLELGIGLSYERRLAGATPSYHNGVMICPTAAGIVVAVDTVSQSLLWAYQFQADNLRMPRAVGRNAVVINPQPEILGDHWQDNTAIMAEDVVLLTPRESNALHCLDQRSGKLLWTIDRGNGLYVAAVADGLVHVVHQDRLESIAVESGQPVDRPVTTFPSDVRVSGRGFFSADYYFLPLTSGQVAKIEVTTGKTVSTVLANREGPLGNLVCHRGAVLSQSSTFLERFEQLDALRTRTQRALAENPSDVRALNALGEIALSEGSVADAIDKLSRAYELEPGNPTTRKILLEALLQGLETDFSSYRERLELVEDLVSTADDDRRLSRLKAVGLQAEAATREAIEEYLRFARLNAGNRELLPFSPHWECRADRWVGGQLTELLAATPAEMREPVMSSLLERRNRLPEAGLVAFEQYVPLVPADFAPTAEQSLELAMALAAENAPLSAYQLATDFRRDGRTSIRAQATAILSNIAYGQQNFSAGRILDRELATAYAATPIAFEASREASSGSRIAVAHAAEFPLEKPPFMAGTSLRAELLNGRGDRVLVTLHAVRLVGPPGPLLREHTVFLDSSRRAVVVFDAFGRQRFAVPLATNNDIQTPNNLTGPRCHARVCGGVLLVSVGEAIYAIDILSRNPQDRLLWGARTVPAASSRPRNINDPRMVLGGNRAVGAADLQWATDREQNLIGWLGPATSEGLVFQVGTTLHCVDVPTGRLLWKQGQIPAGSVLYGDEQFVIAMRPDEQEAVVLRARDGKRLPKCRCPEVKHHLAAYGRQLLLWRVDKVVLEDTTSVARTLTMVDAVSGERLWSRAFAVDAQVALLDGERVGVLEGKSGRFVLIDPVRNEVLAKHLLQPVPDLARIFLMPSTEQTLLVVDQAAPGAAREDTGFSPYPFEIPLITGRIYAFQREMQELQWQAPAEIRQQGLILNQPPDLPWVAFVSMYRRPNHRDANTRLFCLDRATGSTLLRQDGLRTTTPGKLLIQPDPEDDDAVKISLPLQSVKLTTTQVARPPAPATQDSIELLYEGDSGGGLLDVLQRLPGRR